MKHIFACSLAILFCLHGFAQNVGIGTTTPNASAKLDISSTTSGLLIPRVALTAKSSALPVTSPAISLLVYNTNTVADVTPGYYFWNGSAWERLTTDASAFNTSAAFNTSGSFSVTDGNGTITSPNRAWLAGGNNFGTNNTAHRWGTVSNDHIDLLSNNIVRGRLTSQGLLAIGTTLPYASDLFSVVSNSTAPYAISGFTSYNGCGVYGAIQGASTSQAGAVHGENNSNAGSHNSAGVKGINRSALDGTGFRVLPGSGPRMGVSGIIPGAGTYSFGVHGSTPSYHPRTGGLFGDDGGIAMGAVGYFAGNLNDYSFYGFGQAYQTGASGGRVAAGAPVNNHIGMGIYGGVMGGWIRGQVYGMTVKGERYSLYVDGDTYVNKPITQIIETADGNRLAAYTPVSTKTDVTARGKDALQNGTKYIAFDAAFAGMISENAEEITITVTPLGNSNGVYVAAYDEKGFWVKENNSGSSNVQFTWIAISTRKGYETPIPAPELLEKNFDKTMQGVMHNEADPKQQGRPIWWDGSKVRFDNPPPKKIDTDTFIDQRVPAQKDQGQKQGN